MPNIKLLFPVFCILVLCSCHNSKQRQTEEPTNETIHTILSRKSVRNYSDTQISDTAIKTLLRAGMAAPSSRDRRPWHFIVISDKKQLKNLGNKLTNAAPLKEANRAIIVCGDTTLSDNCWFLDCSAATQNILLAAEAMGIGSVWTAVYPYPEREKIVNEALKLPEQIRALAILPLGYPAEVNQSKDKFDEKRIHYNEFNLN